MKLPRRRAFFLDRDGILNEVVNRNGEIGSPRFMQEVRIKEGARALIEKLKAAGFLTIVVTNQPDVGRGIMSRAALDQINEYLQEMLSFDLLEVCVSGEDSDPQRKPNPGMLVSAAEQYNIVLQESYFLGDGIKDIVAGRRAGVRTVLLQTPYNSLIHGIADVNILQLSEVEDTVNCFSKKFLYEVERISSRIDTSSIERAVSVLKDIRSKGGRLFCIGSGGGAGHASHAACDFRKLCGIHAVSPLDNTSELTALVNDEGWEPSIARMLEFSSFGPHDALFVFSVGGGCESSRISVNLVRAIEYGKRKGGSVLAVVGRDGGFAGRHADCVVRIPSLYEERVTPHTESFQAVIWHLIVSHPSLQVAPAKWEGSH